MTNVCAAVIFDGITAVYFGGTGMTYEYSCTVCKNFWEEEQSIKDDPIKVCPECKNESAKRLISKSNFILQGGCWASDGYRK